MSLSTNRILDISEGSAYLRAENDQLVLERKNYERRSIPFEEIAVLVVSSRSVTYTHAVLSHLAAHEAMLVVCDDRSLPMAMSLPLQGHTLQTERLAAQIGASLPVQKELWQQIVRAKIRTQAAVLNDLHGSTGGVDRLAARVRSGDPSNVEAQAARKYWPLLFRDSDFRRELQGGAPPNHLLNYGYAILRAMTARAVVSAGLTPTFGIHHRNRSNSFCLADDLLEPFRPLVDRQAARIVKATGKETPLDKESKALLLAPLLQRIDLDGEHRTVFDVLARVASSLVDVYEGQARALRLPKDIADLQPA